MGRSTGLGDGLAGGQPKAIAVRLSSMDKSFGAITALKGLSLDVERSKFFCVVWAKFCRQDHNLACHCRT